MGSKKKVKRKIMDLKKMKKLVNARMKMTRMSQKKVIRKMMHLKKMKKLVTSRMQMMRMSLKKVRKKMMHEEIGEFENANDGDEPEESEEESDAWAILLF